MRAIILTKELFLKRGRKSQSLLNPRRLTGEIPSHVRSSDNLASRLTESHGNRVGEVGPITHILDQRMSPLNYL